MSEWSVIWEPEVSDAVVRFLESFPDELPALFATSDSLKLDSRPQESVPWGPLYRRARFGRWRLLYSIDDEMRIVHIEHVGRSLGKT